ncbi:MAG: DUF2934 domain-containing protein [Candidatus Didemnitutus sp.]|nr:DUF2934 domain-containing protein [Candidatus Didemnitutus sp.]
MTTPTYEEISLQAHQLWQNRGCPAGCDTEIWLEAERALNEEQAFGTFAARASEEAAVENGYHRALASAEHEAIQLATQKNSARAAQIPHHTGPKSKPAETGKPLWSRPHSS